MKKNRKRALLVRVAADQSNKGGNWNGPVDSKTNKFVYVPIPDDGPFHPDFVTAYKSWHPYLTSPWNGLSPHLHHRNMHLDPDFKHLTYGDGGERAKQIQSKLGPGDLLVFYAGLRDVHSNPRLIYAIIGLYVIDQITPIASVPRTKWARNAHTRSVRASGVGDIVVTAKRQISGRLQHCLPIGSYRTAVREPNKRPCYRVEPSVLQEWGGLTVKDGFLQRSGRLPEFNNADNFYRWFLRKKISLMPKNN